MNAESACFLSPSLKQICHPDRSVAKWRDLLSLDQQLLPTKGFLSPLSSRAYPGFLPRYP
jgi:hypothetical protein